LAVYSKMLANTKPALSLITTDYCHMKYSNKTAKYHFEQPQDQTNGLFWSVSWNSFSTCFHFWSKFIFDNVKAIALPTETDGKSKLCFPAAIFQFTSLYYMTIRLKQECLTGGPSSCIMRPTTMFVN